MSLVFTAKSKAYGKFVERMAPQGMDLTLQAGLLVKGAPPAEVVFTNMNTEFAWCCFKLGWLSHSIEEKQRAYIVGNVTGNGLQLSEKPAIHGITTDKGANLV